MHEVVMPRLSDSMEEGTIIRWLKADGDEVRRGEEILEIETDKATMPYEADADGRLSIAVPAGEVVAVGAPIATIGDAAAAAAPAVARTRSNGGGRDGALNASPVARRIAARLGVDLAAMSGTGPYGRILKADVVTASVAVAPAAAPAPVPAARVEVAPAPAARVEVAPAPAARVEAAPVPAAPVPAPAAEVSPAEGERAAGSTTQALTRTQSLIARRMAESRATVPDFTLELDVDMTAAIELRSRLKAIASHAPSLNDIVVKACAVVLRRHPRANGSYRDGRFELHEHVNVGFAVAAPDALIVPVIRDADVKSLGAVAAETRRLAERVRSGAVTPPELSGGTFTVSNLGMFGIDRFVGIINPPQAAILCVGAVADRAVVRDGQVVVSRTMTLTLACDHRILYGADAAAFLSDLRAALEEPLRLAL
jgi:pyruvate dehydrogenase E2 component (dihydrolipoamide acetyltransferase)